MTDNQIFFSIIIPVYQSKETLSKSLESVLCQIGENFEVILVDDGSTDGSGDVCDEYGEKYPEIIKVIHKKNEGPLIARIEGIKNSIGKYIMFLDADDCFSKDSLQCIREIIRSTDSDMVIFNHFRIYEDGSKEKYSFPLAHNEIIEGTKLISLRKYMITTENLNALWQKCIRREIVKDIDSFYFYGNMIMGEDKIMSLYFLDEAERVVLIDTPLYEYYISDTSLSHKFSKKHYDDLSLVNLQVLKYIKKWKIEDCEILCHRNRVNLGLTGITYVAGNVLRKQNTFLDYKRMIEHIREDIDFWKSFKISKDKLTLRKKVLCLLLKYHMTYLSYFCIVSTLALKGSKHQ